MGQFERSLWVAPKVVLPPFWPNFPTVTHPTPGMPQKTAGFRGQCRFVVLKITALSEDIWH